MIPIDSLIQLGISFYEVPVVIRDTKYTKANGEDTRIILASRTILAAVDPTRSRELERIFGGTIGDGDIGIYTSSLLYVDDAFTLGSDRLQSFATYQGIVYRVAQDADWILQAGIKVYLAKRHLSQDGL